MSLDSPVFRATRATQVLLVLKALRVSRDSPVFRDIRVTLDPLDLQALRDRLVHQVLLLSPLKLL